MPLSEITAGCSAVTVWLGAGELALAVGVEFAVVGSGAGDDAAGSGVAIGAGALQPASIKAIATAGLAAQRQAIAANCTVRRFMIVLQYQRHHWDRKLKAQAGRLGGAEGRFVERVGGSLAIATSPAATSAEVRF